jgi:cytochrome P450
MQSPYLHHTNPDIFPDPFTFKPERWLDNPALGKYLLAFGRGSRICLGMNLAMAEIYLTLAHVFRRFEFELYDTIAPRDVEIIRDSFIGMVDGNSQGIRVRVTKDRVN